jgi:hypothetical protein
MRLHFQYTNNRLSKKASFLFRSIFIHQKVIANLMHFSFFPFEHPLLLLLGTYTMDCGLYKVLRFYLLPAHSHFTLVFRLANKLANQGHDVTVINTYLQTFLINI